MLCDEDVQEQLASCQVDYLGQSARLADLEATLQSSLAPVASPQKQVRFAHQQHQQLAPPPPAATVVSQAPQAKAPIMTADAPSPPPPLPEAGDLLDSDPMVVEDSTFVPSTQSNSLRGGMGMPMLLKVMKSPPFIALIVFLLLVTILAITRVGVCGVQPEGDPEAKRNPNWKAIFTIAGIFASIVLIAPYVLRWRKNAKQGSTSIPALA
jgi:hypothetical protein